MKLSFTLNGHPVEVATEPTLSLLELLRRHLNITSCKEGCGEGECGACAVFVDGRLVNSCIYPVLSLQGVEVTTLEALMEKTRNLRESFERHDAAQCGFCTPGLVMAAYDYLRNGGSPDPEAVKTALDGNLCRCTGYQKIIEAIVDASGEEQ
ncbi:MAG: (2Fe-2S)-binding protein [Sulfuricurvum sp.]|jgi:aerobic-type carbon monoxide dehydrogenase small subunit (CoxS/CutS family)|uniref:(2Fe-2S)-binding protein n=1 Tax=Sulfuricurvum sp. TaxID=2025608 RepID=UPI0026005080|nr:(2Fe-2S)-binding protein [Sulfuricurvum sp.]MCK9373275.1 (2Fe-2S)-binding protein [Sulfuricurvum sp.]